MKLSLYSTAVFVLSFVVSSQICVVDVIGAPPQSRSAAAAAKKANAAVKDAKANLKNVAKEKKALADKKVKDLKRNAKNVAAAAKKQASSASATSPSSTNLVLVGNIGNALTAIFSLLLLVLTPFKAPSACETLCTPNEVCSPCDYSGILDPCYVCDGFCVSNPTDCIWNSHMLSLYADLIFTAALFYLRSSQKEELERLGLDDFYISTLKAFSVAGHGVAHCMLSVLTLLEQFNINCLSGIGDIIKSQYFRAALGVALASSRFTSNNRKSAQRSQITPILTGILLATIQDGSAGGTGLQSSIVDFLLFGLTCFTFFEASIPASDDGSFTREKFAVLATIITTFISIYVLQVKSIQQSFVVVFTSAYLVSATYQIFIWKDKHNDPTPYAVTAWSSNLLTTAVGWLLALACTTMKQLGGHVWYDLSIPISYFLIFYITKYLKRP